MVLEVISLAPSAIYLRGGSDVKDVNGIGSAAIHLRSTITAIGSVSSSVM